MELLDVEKVENVQCLVQLISHDPDLLLIFKDVGEGRICAYIWNSIILPFVAMPLEVGLQMKAVVKLCL